MLKIENKTRLTCRQFYNLLLLLVFGEMVSCRPPREKTSGTKLTCDQVSFFPFLGDERKKEKKTLDRRLVRSDPIYSTKIENLT